MAALCLVLAPRASAAQSRQHLSIQASGEGAFATKSYGASLNTGSTLGWEVQGRFTLDRFSVGVGYQRTTVFKSDAADLTGILSLGFVEPRVVIGVVAQRIAPYVAGRLGYGNLLIPQQPSYTEKVFTYGGGAGVLVAVVPRVAVDVGGQYFVADFRTHGGSAGYWLARLGVAVGVL
jgi:hypothetical protein